MELNISKDELVHLNEDKFNVINVQSEVLISENEDNFVLTESSAREWGFENLQEAEKMMADLFNENWEIPDDY